MQATIHSLEPLDWQLREGIREGIELVTGYMGEVATVQEAVTDQPLNRAGRIASTRLDFSAFDKFTDLHVVVVPLECPSGMLGIAGTNRGTAVINSAVEDPIIARSVAAHEVAHAFGFVLNKSNNFHPDSPGHCHEGSCIEHPSIGLVSQVTLQAKAPTRIDRWLHRPTELLEIEKPVLKGRQYDFCGDCQTAMHEHGSEQRDTMRSRRLDIDRAVRLH